MNGDQDLPSVRSGLKINVVKPVAVMKIIFARKFYNLMILIVGSFLFVACYRLAGFPSSTPLPQPTELAITPLPQGFQAGGLESIFVSQVSADGAEGDRCYTLYRFYSDGLALYTSNACFAKPPSNRRISEIESWFHRENQDLDRGDYYLLGNLIITRIVSYNDIFETTNLRTFQGEICNEKMVMHEPLVRGYSGIPSDLTQPVVEFYSLDPTSKSGEETVDNSCHVAGFKLLFRPSVALSGEKAEYQVQTDPGEICILVYTAPDGSISRAPGTGSIITNDEGICSWVWDLGDIEGKGTVTISIDQIKQDFDIEVR